MTLTNGARHVLPSDGPQAGRPTEPPNSSHHQTSPARGCGCIANKVRSRDRPIRPARGWGAELHRWRGGAVALAFAREDADVLISYLGSEEVDADEIAR